MTNMTTTDLWKALEQVLRDKGATDAWIEYALPDLQVAATGYAAQAYGNGHADARCGRPLPNPGDSPAMNIVTEPDGSRWLELLPEVSLADIIARQERVRDNSSELSHVRGDMMLAPLPAGMRDTPEARERLAEAFRSVGAAERGTPEPRCPYCNDQSPDECRHC